MTSIPPRSGGRADHLHGAVSRAAAVLIIMVALSSWTAPAHAQVLCLDTNNAFVPCTDTTQPSTTAPPTTAPPTTAPVASTPPTQAPPTVPQATDGQGASRLPAPSRRNGSKTVLLAALTLLALAGAGAFVGRRKIVSLASAMGAATAIQRRQQSERIAGDPPALAPPPSIIEAPDAPAAEPTAPAVPASIDPPETDAAKKGKLAELKDLWALMRRRRTVVVPTLLIGVIGIGSLVGAYEWSPVAYQASGAVLLQAPTAPDQDSTKPGIDLSPVNDGLVRTLHSTQIVHDLETKGVRPGYTVEANITDDPRPVIHVAAREASSTRARSSVELLIAEIGRQLDASQTEDQVAGPDRVTLTTIASPDHATAVSGPRNRRLIIVASVDVLAVVGIAGLAEWLDDRRGGRGDGGESEGPTTEDAAAESAYSTVS